jgi:hypothetical protein
MATPKNNHPNNRGGYEKVMMMKNSAEGNKVEGKKEGKEGNATDHFPPNGRGD